MTVRLTAEWALWGKQPGTRGEDGVLACSDGRLGGTEFSEIITRYAPGTPADLPQVTISWFGGGPSAHLGLAVHEWSDERDGLGRDIAMTRYFCVPYARAAEGPVSCEGLYHVFADRPLPVDGPLVVDVPAMDPETTAEAVGETAAGAAALMLTGRPVCVVNGEKASLLDRLRFFDAVAALLPYGFRSRLAASTWTDSSARHRIRLSFARHAPPGAYSIPWGRGVGIPPEQEVARDYHDAIVNCDRLGELVARFAQETQPRSMTSENLAGVLPLMRKLGMAPSGSAPERGEGAQPAAPAGTVRLGHLPPAERAAALASLGVEELVGVVAAEHVDPLTLQAVCAELVSRGGDLTGRAVLGAALRRGHLVAAVEQLHPGDSESQVQRYHDLLTAAYGPMLDHPAVRSLLPLGPRFVPAPLLAALVLAGTPEVRRFLVEEMFLTALDREGVTAVTLDRLREVFRRPGPGPGR